MAACPNGDSQSACGLPSAVPSDHNHQPLLFFGNQSSNLFHLTPRTMNQKLPISLGLEIGMFSCPKFWELALSLGSPKLNYHPSSSQQA